MTTTQHIVMPGTAGNNISTEAVNLLDADTAHVHQSIGEWSVRGQAADIQLIADASAPFGSYVLQWRAASAATTSIRNGTPATTLAVTASTTYSATAKCRTKSGVARQARIVLEWYNGASYVGPPTAGALVTLPADGSWVQLPAASGAANPAVDNASLYVEVQSAAANELFQIDEVCVREGADATFVPSLGIVGDLEINAKVAADDWTPAADGYFARNLSGFDGFYFGIDTTGALFAAHGDGSSARAELSPVLTATNGAAYTVGVEWDVSAGSLEWFQDGVSLGTDAYSAGAGSPSTADLVVGTTFAGDLYYVEVRDGIGGPIVAKMLASDAAGAV